MCSVRPGYTELGQNDFALQDHPKENGDQEIAVTPDTTGRFCTERDRSVSRCTGQDGGESEVHPTGFEPVTFGSVVG